MPGKYRGLAAIVCHYYVSKQSHFSVYNTKCINVLPIIIVIITYHFKNVNDRLIAFIKNKNTERMASTQTKLSTK